MPDRARSESAAPHVLRQVGLWASVAKIAAISALSYVSIRSLVRNAEHADRTQSPWRKIDLLVSELKDAEIGQRGFLITGIEEYLDPYRSALAAVPRRLATLRARLDEACAALNPEAAHGEYVMATHNGNGNGDGAALQAHQIGKPYRKVDLARMLRKALADGTEDKEKH